MDIVDRDVDVDQIDITVGPEPSDRLVENVKRNGVIVPVILAERADEDGELHYVIVDGNRRVAAAREAEVPVVPARVLQGVSDAEMANLTLLTNNFRTSNYVTEFWAMNELQRAGVSRKQLPEVTGWTPSTIATREHLSQLERRLFIGLSEGRISPTVALAAAKLDRDSQARLGDIFQKTRRLTKRDVDEVAPKPVGDLPEIDTEGRLLPEDLQLALTAIARQAVSRGIDADVWSGAGERAWREASGG
ncbi:MAG TPA: ParB N-terminal domain-containing protein [Thermomicrobiales bacterium]|nr:ParB N-terminal domain-containing protein [Thermomicrobiales bacterium]